MTCAQKDSMLLQTPVIVPFRADQIDAVWSEAAPLIRLAQSRFERSAGMADIYGDLISGRAMLWAIRIGDKLRAVIITEIARHPRRSAWRIVLIGGSGMSEWLQDSLEAMRRAAKIAGCSSIEADGRLGWARIALRCGFKEVTRAYEMEI